MNGMTIRWWDFAHLLRFVALLLLCGLAVGLSTPMRTVDSAEEFLMPLVNRAAVSASLPEGDAQLVEPVEHQVQVLVGFGGVETGGMESHETPAIG